MMKSLCRLVLGVLLLATTTRANEWVLQSVLRGTAGHEDIFGLVQLTENPADGSLTVEASVLGLPDGSHGFHIHQYGDVVGTMDGTATGGHYNPWGVDHSGPDATIRHVGDLGNLESINGMATYTKTFLAEDMARPTILSNLTSSAMGRAFVIHADPDDLVSQPTGNAGSRLAAGVIGIGNTDAEGLVLEEQIDSDDFEMPQALVCAMYDNNHTMMGSAKIVLNGEGVATVTAAVNSLAPNQGHGFHIHQYGDEYDYSAATWGDVASSKTMTDVTRDLTRAGGHYNPMGVAHGLDTETRHYGDVGNLQANEDGFAMLDGLVLPGVTNLRHFVGRSCLIHADPDDGSDPAGKRKTSTLLFVCKCVLSCSY